MEAAEDFFYARGIQAVTMDEIRAASGVSLKRLYALFPSKSALVHACLEARDARWRARLAAYVDSRPGPPQDRVLAVFDKDAFRVYVTGLVVAAGQPAESAVACVPLAEGAIVTAAVFGTPEPARQARRAAAQLLADTAVT